MAIVQKTREDLLRRNFSLLNLYSILIKRPTMPIIILYFLLHSLNYTQIGILASVMAVLQIITEVHGGIFADKHGKKTSLLLSAVFGFLTMLFYIIGGLEFGNSFVWFLIASVCYGISGAFITGTRNSLMYDSLLELGEASLYKQKMGKMVFVAHNVNAVVLLIVPVLYSYFTVLPFVIGLVFFACAILMACFMVEPIVKSSKDEPSIKKVGVIGPALSYLKSHKLLLTLILFGEILVAFVWVTQDYVQPLLTISGLSVIYFGFVYAAFRSLQGLGSWLAHKFEKWFSFRIIAILLLIGLGLTLFMHAGLSGFWLFIPLILIRLLVGVNKIIYDDEMNQVIPSKWRTTLLSIGSLFQSLMVAILAFIFGIVADSLGVQGMFWWLSMSFVIMAVVLYFLFGKYLPKGNVAQN